MSGRHFSYNNFFKADWHIDVEFKMKVSGIWKLLAEVRTWANWLGNDWCCLHSIVSVSRQVPSFSTKKLLIWLQPWVQIPVSADFVGKMFFFWRNRDAILLLLLSITTKAKVKSTLCVLSAFQFPFRNLKDNLLLLEVTPISFGYYVFLRHTSLVIGRT